MSNVINIQVSTLTPLETIITKVNEQIEGKNVKGIFFDRVGIVRGNIEVFVEEPQTINVEGKTIIVERPSKFKTNATSQYYCVYKKGNGWTYKFVNTKLNPKPFLGKLYETEYEAALAYDEHRYSVEGDLSKLNFPERFTKGVK